MSNWRDDDMPIGMLVLCRQDGYVTLRRLESDGTLWSEDEFLDDSGIEVDEWCYIPE